jgi:hypothetical protein
MKKHKSIRFYEINCFVYANYFLTMIVKEQYKQIILRLYFDITLSLTLLFGYKYLTYINEENITVAYVFLGG